MDTQLIMIDIAPDKITHEEWIKKYNKLRAIADRISTNRTQALKRLCKQAGLDSMLLGIHPNNAMAGYNHNEPWPEVNYTIVKKIYHLQRTNYEYQPYDIIRKWDKRVR